MSMQSMNLLPELQKLPGPESNQRKSFRDTITDLLSMDRGLYAVEASAAVSFAMWGIFDTINVDDKLAQAYEMQYPGQAEELSLHDKWQELAERGDESMDGFISGLKGKVAEINATENLKAQGYTDVEIAPDPTQPDWDINAISPEGQEVLIQIKTGLADRADEVRQLMADNPDVQYAVSTEIYREISEDSPELINQMLADDKLAQAYEMQYPNEAIEHLLYDKLQEIGRGAEIYREISEDSPELINQMLTYDKLVQAYEMHFPRPAEELSLHDKWQELVERGPKSTEGFINSLKGKVAEIDAKEIFEAQGYTNVAIAENPTQRKWDIRAISPEGQEVKIQVKTGSADRASEIEQLMAEDPDVHYAVTTEIFDKISERSPELIKRMTDIGLNSNLEAGVKFNLEYGVNIAIYDKIAEDSPDLIDQMTLIGSDYELVDGVTDGLETLSDNQGIDLPDSVGEIVPYAGAFIISARLIYKVIKTEKEFSTADRTTKNKMQVVQVLTTMARFGISTVLSTIGGVSGATAGSFVPGIGNFIGGITGTIAGAGMGIYLNKHLQPHMLNLALDITGLTHDDLFYYKNKPHIDSVALSYRKTAGLLTAAS